MDTSAAHVFANALSRSDFENYIATSEAKDEHGEHVSDPLSRYSQYDAERLGLAVDVVDGTTLAAKGIDGAYTLSAAASGLKAFPDMQAYAIGAPKRVLDHISFSNRPEDEARRLVELLCQFYNKKACDLRIVTHSSDTGNHHKTLIEILRNMGVQVIIPEPVIVEPPFVLGMAFRTENAPDCMIGVFGLPEIVINTLLLKTLHTEYELRFQIASNTMLKNQEGITLDEAFAFTPDELKKLDSLKLQHDMVYAQSDICSREKESCFSATALTNDNVFGLHGCKVDGNNVTLETVFAGYDGYALKLTTSHKLNNFVNYAACYPQPIDDLSVVLPVTDEKVGVIAKKLTRLLSDKTEGNTNPFAVSNQNELHVTLFEYGVHYGGYADKEELMQLKKMADEVVHKIDHALLCRIEGIDITKDAILLRVCIDDAVKEQVTAQLRAPNNLPFANVNTMPTLLHITLARFSQYIDEATLCRIIDAINAAFTEEIHNNGFASFSSEPKVVHIITTPYTMAD